MTTAASTDFPAAPSSGDQYFRTDLGLDCYYDGTRWLTKNEYAINFWPASAVEVISDDQDIADPITLGTDDNVYITSVAGVFGVGSTNGGSDYWDIVLYGYQQNFAGGQTFATLSTAALTAGQTTALEVAATLNMHATDNVLFQFTSSETGDPSNLYVDSLTIYYRKIIT